ncbi:MAG: hypothetical protein ACRDP7_46960 [Trebonia sp.]
MTALADLPVAQAGPRTYREPGGPGPGPAAAEVWSGWVGIAQKTGFGAVPLLPGIWPSLHLDTAVTLPVGVECYAAYALRAWLTSGHAVSDRTRRFARWSAICSFALGMAGQVAFHLMNQDHVTRAPWGITTLVSCLPVLGMRTALAHMLREDAAVADQPNGPSGGPADARSPSWSAEDQPADHPDRHRDQDQPDQVRDQLDGTRTTVRTTPSPGTSASTLSPGSAAPPGAAGRVVSRSRDQDGVQASLIALRLATAGKPVSRRALRNGGVKGSNESLNALARQLNAEFANDQTTVPAEAPGEADERDADSERAGRRRTRRAPRAVPPPGGIPPGN